MRGPKVVYVFASHPFDGTARVGQFRGRVLNVTVEDHEVILRSFADRPIYPENGAPVYASRIFRTAVDGAISETGIASRLSDVGGRVPSSQ